MTTSDTPTRREIENERRADLIDWASTHAPELLPVVPEDVDPDEWPSIFDRIESAQFQATPRTFTPDPRFAHEEDPF